MVAQTIAGRQPGAVGVEWLAVGHQEVSLERHTGPRSPAGPRDCRARAGPPPGQQPVPASGRPADRAGRTGWLAQPPLARRARAYLTGLVRLRPGGPGVGRRLATPWDGVERWFHGDVAAGNLLLDDAEELSAVIDFGTCGVGDPAGPPTRTPRTQLSSRRPSRRSTPSSGTDLTARCLTGPDRAPRRRGPPTVVCKTCPSRPPPEAPARHHQLETLTPEHAVRELPEPVEYSRLDSVGELALDPPREPPTDVQEQHLRPSSMASRDPASHRWGLDVTIEHEELPLFPSRSRRGYGGWVSTAGAPDPSGGEGQVVRDGQLGR